MPYSLIHCKTIRTGIHKGNPLVPFVESGDVVLLKTLFAKLSARTGRFGNPIGRVSDGSFPYFCPYRNRVPARHERKIILKILLYFISTNKRPVILSAWRERIRIPLERRTDCHGAKAPRNDKENGKPQRHSQ